MTHKNYIFVRIKMGLLEKINHSDIRYIEANGDYVKIFTTLKMYYIHSTLLAITTLLPSEMFYRCHRSFTVNIDRIDKIEDDCACIESVAVPIGEQYKKELLIKINVL